MHKKNIKKTFLIFVIFLFAISIGYSALYEKISLNATASLKTNRANNDYNLEYKLTSWNSGKYEYQFNPISLTYTGKENVNTWEIIIEVPDDSTISACWNVKCIMRNGKLIIRNERSNATIKPNTTLTNFGFQISTAMANYELNVEDINFYTPSNPNPNEQIITDNISVEYSNRGGWQSGEKYVSQIYIDIKNNTNVDFSYWELIIKRPPNSSIKSLWGASFVEKDDTIIITGENGNNSFYSSNSKSIGMQIEVEDANTQLETLKVFGKGIVE